MTARLLSPYYRSVSSDTIETPNHSEIPERRTFHWKMLPSKAKALAVFARLNGMTVGGAAELAIDMLVKGSVTRERSHDGK